MTTPTTPARYADEMRVRKPLLAGDAIYDIFSLEAAEKRGIGPLSRLPVTLKILLESLLRRIDGRGVTAEHVRAVVQCGGGAGIDAEIPFHPVRVLLPDSSGIPLLADLAAMREAMTTLGGDPRRVNPLIPIDFVIDHSLMVDFAGRPDAFALNLAAELERNHERYSFLRWAEQAFANFRLIPPGNGILHQINLETLARVVWTERDGDATLAMPDVMVGMDSHTPMINSLGVLGWGVGGIEAAAAMLGQPMQLRLPEVIGCRLTGRPSPGVTTTDIVLTLTQRLRKRGVIAAFVEFCGPGIDWLALPERATLANMAVEYGATTAFFPVDDETLRYLRLTGRAGEHVALVEAYAKEQGLWRGDESPQPTFNDVVEFDLGSVEPSLAGPRRPHDRVRLADVPESFRSALQAVRGASPAAGEPVGGGAAAASRDDDGERRPLEHGDVVIAAITSCTNTSNPSVMVAAGLLARNAVARGLRRAPWVKTSLAPGSRIVTDYLREAGLQESLDALGFHTVGYGCTTCMGNSGPLDDAVARQVDERGLVVTAVLSGNRNFESRIHAQARTNYLASPPLVVAYAIAGSIVSDLANDPLGHDAQGRPVHLRDVWPSDDEIRDTVEKTLSRDMFVSRYGGGFVRPEAWERLPHATGESFAWPAASEYMRRPPFFDRITREPPALEDIVGARPLLILGDTVTTDHISPIGSIPRDGPAGRYLMSRGVQPRDFNFFGARRVNHEVMMRGTFANLQIRNEMVPGSVGGVTRHMPDGEITSVYDAAMKYAARRVPAVVVAGVEYGAGSSRDWAAKGTRLLGVRAVIAESFERIHRANLVGMGVLPLELVGGATRRTLGLDGSEQFTIEGVGALSPRAQVQCRLTRANGVVESIPLRVRIDTAVELDWFRHGGVLDYVLRQLLEPGRAAD